MDELLHTGHEEAQESGLSLAPLRARLTGGAPMTFPVCPFT